MEAKVNESIRLLGLSQREPCEARREYVRAYEKGPDADGIGLQYLERRAPFIARELRRQGRLLRGDT
jgi:hypothetical protein